MKRDELCIKTVVLAWLYDSRVRSDEKREGSRAARHVAYSRACIFVYHINVRETGGFFPKGKSRYQCLMNWV